MERSWRNLGLAIGGFLLIVGLLLILLSVSRREFGFGEFGAAVIGAVLSIFGIIFTGFGSGVRALYRRVSTRRLARRLSRILGSPAEPNLETASILWVGMRDRRRAAISWSLDYPGTQVAMEIEGGSPGTLRILPKATDGSC